jgi:hypothetical protein
VENGSPGSVIVKTQRIAIIRFAQINPTGDRW